MRTKIFLILFLSFSLCNAQHKIKTYFEKTETGYNYYGDNGEYCPMSVKIDFTVSNLEITGGNNKIFVLEANKDKQLLTTLTISKTNKPYKVSAKTMTNYGDHNLHSYDENFAYDLPFSNGKSFAIYQGYNGSFSHQNENSLDFTMPIGTEITAIRDGIIISVVQKNKIGCPKEDCKKYNNGIIIYHPDGSFSEYAHIKFNGSVVKVGDKVMQGQLIGYSGNVGWSTGPHLHLVIFQQKIDKRNTLKTKFKTGKGDRVETLVEKNTYIRDY